MNGAILPGATIGVLGSGQLGRMFAIAARRMGYRVHAFSPDDDTPTGQVADRELKAPYDDLDAVRAFAERVDVVTFEFENIPAATVEEAARWAPVRPGGSVLFTTQHRLREKMFLSRAGFPVVPFRAVRSLDELTVALGEFGAPAVLKTAGWGYDGKGQAEIASHDDAVDAWKRVATSEAVLEAFVDFDCEISVVAARSINGQLTDYGAIGNTHVNHILDVSVSPAAVSPEVANQAVAIARNVLTELDVVGVLCVEFFVAHSGSLLINELAPRPHNSGHLTFDACVTSQFEQQLRAVCGLPLGSTQLLRPAAMANLLGDLWQAGAPDWRSALAFPDVKLHLYGKEQARVGRKMGHLTTLAATAAEAAETVRAARRALGAECQLVESPTHGRTDRMVLDDLQNVQRYYNLHPGFREGFEFLSRPRLRELASGKYELQGDRVFALINRDPGRGRQGARLEAHRKYIDIQLLVDGSEEIGWRPTAECRELTDPYNDERDIMFFADRPHAWIQLPVNKFMIFYPQDAHAPLASTGDNVKAVIKVAV